jgi:hypothetical protein
MSLTIEYRLLRSAKWRKAPASESQKNFVAKRWGVSNFEGDEPEQGLGALTKGEAANIITRLKHGAKVRETDCHIFCIKLTSALVVRKGTIRRQRPSRRLLTNQRKNLVGKPERLSK